MSKIQVCKNCKFWVGCECIQEDRVEDERHADNLACYFFEYKTN